MSGFNTASGKYCCNFKLADTESNSDSFNTASGKYCCNKLQQLKETSGVKIVSIPQAVSTVATFAEDQGIQMYRVSIPQAVSTVAT